MSVFIIFPSHLPYDLQARGRVGMARAGICFLCITYIRLSGYCACAAGSLCYPAGGGFSKLGNLVSVTWLIRAGEADEGRSRFVFSPVFPFQAVPGPKSQKDRTLVSNALYLLGAFNDHT